MRPARSPRVAADELGEDPVGVDDPAVAVAVDDQVAERVDQAAEALLALLQLPHAVGQRLVFGEAAFGGRVDFGGEPALGARGERKQDQRADADAEQRDGNEVRRAEQIGEARQ